MSADDAPARAPFRITQGLVSALALVGLLAIIAIIALAAQMLSFGRSHQPARVAGAEPESIFTIGNVEELGSGNLIRMDITVSDGGSGSGSYSGGSGNEVRNILLLDRSAGTSRKLLPDNERRIAGSHFLAAESDLEADGQDRPTVVEGNGKVGREGDEPEAPAAYYVLEVKQADGTEKVDLLVGTLSSGTQDYVMRGLDGVDSIWKHGPTQVGLIVRERLRLYYRIIDIPSLKTVASKRIEIG